MFHKYNAEYNCQLQRSLSAYVRNIVSLSPFAYMKRGLAPRDRPLSTFFCFLGNVMP